MRAQIYETILDTVMQEWQELWAASPTATIMNSPSWLLSAIEAFGYKDFRIVAVYDSEEKLKAVAAFCKQKVLGMNVYAFPALNFVDKPSILNDFSNREVTSLLFSEIKKLGTVYLTELRIDAVQSVTRHIKTAGFFRSDFNPYIVYSEGEMYGSLSKDIRKKFTNRAKKLSEADTANMLHSKDRHAELMPLVFDIDNSSAKMKKGKGVFDDKNNQTFYRLLAEKNPNNTLVSILYFGKKPISYALGFVCNNIYTGSQKAFLTGYEYNSPGTLLIMNLLEHMYSENSPEFDLGKGYDRFKMHFTDKTRQLHSVIISNSALKRSYMIGSHTLSQKLYSVIEKYPKVYKKYRQIKNKFKN